MADFDEELRRQAAISSLLAQQPESQPLDTQTDEQVVAQPEVIQPDTQTDYHKLIDQAFDTKTDEQVTPTSDYPAINQNITYPTIAQDQGQPDKLDTVTDQQVVAPAPDKLTQVEKGELVKAPDMGERGTPITPQPQVVDTPVDSKGIPLDEKPVPQPLDKGEAPAQLTQVERGQELTEPWHPAVKPNVPGFVEGSQNAIINPAAGVVPPTPKPAYPDQIVTPDEASGAKSTVNAPAPAQVTQPASNDDYNKLIDSFFPSAKPADTSASPMTGEFQPDTSGSTRLNARMNNPGALGLSAWEQKYGATPSGSFDTGHSFAQFPTKEAGAAAQFDLWRRSGQFNGQTLGNAITNWIGPGEHGEAEYISQATGIPLNQVIDEDFLKSPAGIRLMQAQAHYEGANVLTAEQWKRGQDWAYSGIAPAGDTSTTATAAPAQNKMPWDDWAKLSPADQAAAEKEGQDFRTQQTSVLDKLNRSTPNPKQFWDKLQQPIEGVTDSQRQAYADNFKQEVTKYAQDFYGEKDPEKAFSRAVSDPGLEAYVSNIGRGLAGAVGQADIGIALAGKSIDRNRVDGFMNLVHPDSTGEGRAGFVKALTDIQDTRHRHDVFNEIYGALPQNTKDAIGDPASILDSIDNLANPEQQVALNKAIATKKAWVDRQLAGDPQLRGTGADWWTTGTGENLFNTVAALVPGGVGAVVRTSTLGAQIYSSNLDRIAQKNPSLTPEQVSDEASKSAFMTLLPQEVIMALSHGITAPLLKWVGAAAERPIVRFGIGGGIQVGAAAVGGAAGQVGENIAENKNPLTNVPQAAGSAIVQSLPFAVHGGIGALGHEVAPIEHAAPVEPASTEPAPSRPVTRGEILGPDEPPPPASIRPWYMQGAEPGQDPLVIRGAERTAFTPQELSEAIQRMPNGTPEELQAAIEKLISPTGVHLGDESAPEIKQAQAVQAVPRPLNVAEAIGQARADAVAAKLGGVPSRPAQATSTQPVRPGNAQDPATIALRSKQNHIYAVGPDGHENVAMILPNSDGTFKVMMPRQGMHDPNTVYPTADAAQTGARNAFEKAGWKVSFDPREVAAGPSPPTFGNISGEESGVQREANKSTAHGVIDELTKGVANKYAEERMKAGELDPIDPNTGLTTEELMARALKMRPQEVQDHINNFMDNRGGDPRDQAAAVRRQESFLTDRNRALSLKAETNPHDIQAVVEAAAARKELNDFYSKGGPISKMKELFHVHGKGLQGEPSIDLSTEGGLHEKFLRETGRPPPPSEKPRLKKSAERVRTTHSDEYKARDKVDKAIDKDGRKKIPSIEEVRDYVAKRMDQMPCRK